MAPPITTAEQLLRAQDVGRCELVRGELRTMIPPGFEHSLIAMNLGWEVSNHVRAHDLGRVVTEPGFILARDPDTVRAPDIAFVRAERLVRTAGYFEGAPDLAVEVLSPDDRPGYVREKVAEWLEAGTQAVWVVDPRARTVVVHESNQEPSLLREADTLDGGELLPGFELAVRDIFS